MAITFKKKYKDEVTGEWSCPVCEVKMDSQHAFTVHIRQHNPTDHSHTCSICAKQLSSASSLDRHMLIHSGERPFKCRICQMAFTTNGNMHRHMRTHGQDQQQAVGYISSSTIDEEGMRVRNKKKRKPKSLPNSSPVNTQSNNSSFGFDDLSIKDSFLALLQLQNRTYNSFGNEFNFDLQRKDSDFDNSAYFLQNKSLNQLNLTNEKFLENKESKTSTEDFDESEHRSTTSSEEQQEISSSEKNGNQNSDDEENKLDLKRSLSQNSTLYNTLFKCNNLTAAAVANSTNSKSDLADISSILSLISNVTPMFANATADLQNLPFNEEQVAKITQIRQQALQNQNALLNSTTKSSSKRSKNGDYSRSQSNGNSRSLNTSINGKRIKRDTKDNNNSLENSFNLDNSDQLKNISLEDDKSDQSIKNGSDIENEMTNGDRKFKNKTKLSSSSQQHQQLSNNEDTIEDDEEEEDEDMKNLSEEEEANKMEQEQQQFLLNKNENSNAIKKIEEASESNSDDNESSKKKSESLDVKNKKNEASFKQNEKDISSDSLKNSLASLITPKRSTTENLADLLIKSDKNNNKNMRNNNGTNDINLNQRFFIDPMVEDDVKLLERQLQDQQYLCRICNLEVRSVNTLRRHQRLHDSGGQLYECSYCSYTSLDKSSLIRHLRTHNGERPYQCTICKYAFTTKANCERHVRKRHKKQNKNDIRVSMLYKVGNGNSDALISLNGSLQASNNSDQILDNIPPSSLVETNKSLLASSNMHLIPHVYYEPNSIETSCRYCHVDFRFNRLLRQHLRTMCNNNFTKKPFNCSLCNQGFTTKNVCIRHFEKNHKEVPHDQISSMIIEYNSEEPKINNNRYMNGSLNTSILNSATGVFNSNNSGSDSGHLSNGDSNELDQPLNLVSGLYNGMKKFNSFSNDRYMDNDEDQFDQDNQNALDLSIRSNEKSSLDHLNSINRSLELNIPNINNNNSLPEPADFIRNAITSLLALQSFVPKSLSETNQQLVAQASSLLAGQNLAGNSINNFTAAQANQASGSLLNLFNTFI